MVNSMHHQAIKQLAPGLVVTATAPDGVIEAVEGLNGQYVVAVQWHPEWRAHENPQSQTFFELLGRALRLEPLVQD